MNRLRALWAGRERSTDGAVPAAGARPRAAAPPPRPSSPRPAYHGPARDPAAPAGSTVTVTGLGCASAPPDAVRVRLTATALRPTLAAALGDSEEAARRVRAALAGVGVDVADATTQGLSVHAEQSWTADEGSRVTGFRSEHELAVTLRDIPGAGRVLGEVLVAGGDDVRLYGIDFVVEDDAALRAGARDLAWADAHARADQLASLAGRRLGAVRTVVEGDGPTTRPEPVVHAMMAGGDPQPVVEPGAVGVQVTLTVCWELG
jgi:uncharacterized protein